MVGWGREEKQKKGRGGNSLTSLIMIPENYKKEAYTEK